MHPAYYDTNETLETKLLAGSSGFDIVVPSASYFERQIKAGAYLVLDKSKLPNLQNMDPQLMARVASNDPGNAHGVIYLWGSNGIGYNEKMVKALMPDAPLDSWRLVFDPAVAAKVAKCGISLLDSPAEMLRAVYSYMGKDPNSQSAEDLAQAEAVLLKIRPYIRNFSSSEYIEALANGDLCISVAYNGDVMQARDRAREANKGIEIKYVGAQGRIDPVVRHAGDPEGCTRSRQRLRIHELHDDAPGYRRCFELQALRQCEPCLAVRWCCRR